MRCGLAVSFAVMFNGGKLDDFRPTRGLGQEDPVSSYLFLLAAEGLSCLLKANEASNLIRELKVAAQAPQVNHLLFADDNLLFFEATSDSATKVKDLLHRYCDASGQRINVDKSSIFFSKGVTEPNRASIKNILEVQIQQQTEVHTL